MLENYYVDSFTVKRPTETKTNGVIKTTFVESEIKKGKIDPLSSAVIYENGAQRVMISHKIFASIKEDIKEKDVIVYGNKQFNVVEVLNPFSLGHHIEALLQSRF